MPCSKRLGSITFVAAAGVRVEHEYGYVVGAVVADRDCLADERAGRFQLLFDVGRGHILARGIDDELFLAIDDLHVPLVVDLGDVASV